MFEVLSNTVIPRHPKLWYQVGKKTGAPMPMSFPKSGIVVPPFRDGERKHMIWSHAGPQVFASGTENGNTPFNYWQTLGIDSSLKNFHHFHLLAYQIILQVAMPVVGLVFYEVNWGFVSHEFVPPRTCLSTILSEIQITYVNYVFAISQSRFSPIQPYNIIYIYNTVL